MPSKVSMASSQLESMSASVKPPGGASPPSLASTGGCSLWNDIVNKLEKGVGKKRICEIYMLHAYSNFAAFVLQIINLQLGEWNLVNILSLSNHTQQHELVHVDMERSNANISRHPTPPILHLQPPIWQHTNVTDL